jgi:nuclear RNA export factor
VRPADGEKLLKLNGFQFAKTTLEITKRTGSADSPGPAHLSQEATQVRDMLKSVLARRYDADLKLLNLSNLGADEELIKSGLFDLSSATSKLFPALMKVADEVFKSAQDKRDAIISVTLAGNSLPGIRTVTTLAQTFPDTKNIDLSNNQIADMRGLDGWRHKFKGLEHLVLTENPIEKLTPNYAEEILKWWPSLLQLNNVQVRTVEEIATKKEMEKQGIVPLPNAPARFEDEGQIAENFIKAFFPAYDTNRELAASWYDNNSSFSFSVNTSAPRAESNQLTKQVWDSYIKSSRNLVKLNHLHAQKSRIYHGATIREHWASMPATKHPEFGSKWLIETHSLPSLPGDHIYGVGGLIVTVHGEFEEAGGPTRSFDRTFVLGPGGGPGGVKVINDALVLRAYGGNNAWAVELPAIAPVAAIAEPTEEIKQAMMLELSNRTRMTLPYAQLALQEKGWNFEEGLAAFEAVKVSYFMKSLFYTQLTVC